MKTSGLGLSLFLSLFRHRSTLQAVTIIEVQKGACKHVGSGSRWFGGSVLGYQSGFPRSWKSGKVMEKFVVMESHGKVMENNENIKSHGKVQILP